GTASATAAASPSTPTTQATVLDPALTPIQQLTCAIVQALLSATGPTLLNIFVTPKDISVEDVIVALVTNQWEGRQIVGNGADGTADSPDGKAGGWLIGNGGNGYSPPAGSGLTAGKGGDGGLIGNGGNGGAGAAGLGTDNGQNGGAGGSAFLWGTGGTG